MSENKQHKISSRLKFSRKNAGFSSVRDAAEALDVKYPTYAGHENGTRGMSRNALELYARRFKISLDWLLTGKGDMKPRLIGKDLISTVSLMGYIGAGGEILPEFGQISENGIEQIEVPFPLLGDMIAFEVQGDSMLPVYEEGNVLICYKEQMRSIECFYGKKAAVKTIDGQRYVKQIMRSYQDGKVNLISWNSTPIENVELEWIGEIFAIVTKR
ncbi:MAG: putative transcriptional regulator [Candidatus Tokpelaia sp. JSC189]|nr:MAG: putative transcriptional regulator [Candidatus Tokpelaia sp. JSC189]